MPKKFIILKAVTKGEWIESKCQVGKHFLCEENSNITKHLRLMHKPALPTQCMYIVQYMEAGRGGGQLDVDMDERIKRESEEGGKPKIHNFFSARC
jgi:hypothetical protein